MQIDQQQLKAVTQKCYFSNLILSIPFLGWGTFLFHLPLPVWFSVWALKSCGLCYSEALQMQTPHRQQVYRTVCAPEYICTKHRKHILKYSEYLTQNFKLNERKKVKGIPWDNQNYLSPALCVLFFMKICKLKREHSKAWTKSKTIWS